MTHSKIAMRQEHTRKILLDFRSLTRNFLNGSGERVRRNADRKEVKDMSETEKQLWKNIVAYVEITKQDQEKIAEIRRELAELSATSSEDIAF